MNQVDREGMRYDVAIVGGGPAGTVAALSLKRLDAGLEVALVEASRYTSWRGGETLGPGGAELLRSLGCWQRFSAHNGQPTPCAVEDGIAHNGQPTPCALLESYGTISAWGATEAYENEFVFSARGNGWHTDRRRFDEMLCECAAEAGVSVFLETRLTKAQRIAGRGWRLKVRTGSIVSEIEAQFAVDATGRAARLATQLGAKRVVDDNLAGVFVTFRFSNGAAPADRRTLVEAQEDGWWYSCIVPGPRAVLAWMSDTDLIRDRGLARNEERWREHLERSNLTAARVSQAEPEMPPVTLSARSQQLVPAAGAGWVAAGDAASSFDPLSSQGILKAIHSGKISSFVAYDWLKGRESSVARYDARVAAEYKAYRAAKASFYALERRWPESPFWARRQSIPSC